MEKNFEPLKDRLRIICDRLDPEEQVSFRPLIDNFTGITSEFQRIMRDLGKYGGKSARAPHLAFTGKCKISLIRPTAESSTHG
jgi:hypothetical protein